MSAIRISLIGLILPMAAFAQNPEILINSQGLAQQDLSIRGSGYSGAGLSLNGLNLKVPCSAHFNADLPIPDYLLTGPHVQYGLDNVSGSLVGTAAYQTEMQNDHLRTTLGFGTREHYSAKLTAFGSGVGGFIEGEKALRIDHDANGLERCSGGAYLQHLTDDWQIDLLAGFQQKDFGAQGYYGIPSTTYAEEQTRDLLLFLGAAHGELDSVYFRAGTAFRRFDNEYSIPSVLFDSNARSYLGSLFIEGRTLEIQNIALNLRGDIEHERTAGDIGNHDRTRGSILVLPEVRFERLTIKAGLSSVFQTDESAEWLPQGAIDFFVTDNIRLYAAYSETVQQPDFQSLYYSDPYHTGNDSLDLQLSKNTELGLHQFLSAQLDWRAAAFHRRQENVLDWTKATAADTAWTATDLGTLDVCGIDAKLNYLASDELDIQLYYQWITKGDYDTYAGLYELDYPEHLLGISGFWQFTPELQVFGAHILRLQTDNNIRNSSNFGAEASLGLHYDPRFAKNTRLSFLVENLWDTDFQPIPGLKPRPVTFSSGITVNW